MVRRHPAVLLRPVAEVFGAFPYVVGTLLSSTIALVIAAPIGLLTAIFLSELAPRRVAIPLTFLIELLAAIPSVVFGLWGVFVLSPFLRDTVEKAKNAAQRMISQEPDLVGVTGAWLSSFTLGVTEVTERAELPLLTLSYSDALTSRGFGRVVERDECA